MKLKYFTNSMALITGKNCSVLFDPWITFNRTSANNLYNFPEPKFSKEEIASLKPDYIYITHTHADHFDKRTLDLFDKNTPVLCADFENNFTERNLITLGFKNVIVCKPDVPFKLSEKDECFLYHADINPEVDSLAIFKIDNITMLNANDVVYSKKQMDQIGKKFNIEFAMVPYAYQGPYPAFYENLSKDERVIKAKEKKVRNYELMYKYIESINPKKVFPFAAGCVYGGPKALQYAYYGVGTALGAVEYCKSKGQNFEEILINGGAEYDFDTEQLSEKFKPITHADQDDYLKKISTYKSIFDDEFFSEKLEQYFPHSEEIPEVFQIGKSYQQNLTKLIKKARSNQMKWQKKMNFVSNKAFYIDVGHDHLYRLDLKNEDVSMVKEKDIIDDSYEIFRCSYSLFIGLLTGHFNYSNVKTGLMTFYRKPDIFDPKIHTLMSYLQL